MRQGLKSRCFVRNVTNESNAETGLSSDVSINFAIVIFLCRLLIFCLRYAVYKIVTTFGCDWPSHQRSSVISDPSVDACSCKTPHAEDCNWLVCVDCFTQSTYGLKAPHQTYNLQVCEWYVHPKFCTSK